MSSIDELRKKYNYTGPIPVPFHFETLVTKEFGREFVEKYWHYSIYISVIYVILIGALQHHMKSRPAYNLQRAFAIWNALLAFFSIIIILRGIPILYLSFTNFTLYDLCCDKKLIQEAPPLFVWGLMFLFSKVWELGDTFMLILNKKKLMFLHCYHHVTILIISWFSIYKESSYLALCGNVNVFVHSLMYTYFTLKCLNIKVPRIVAMFITTMQIIQMLFVCVISCWIYWILVNGHPCDTPIDVFNYYFAVFFSYLFLFLHLFYKSYLCRGNKKNKNV